MLSKAEIEMNYYSWYENTNKYEIDFAISLNSNPWLIEVKSGRNNTSQSLTKFLTTKKEINAIKLVMGNASKVNKTLIVPIYELFFLIHSLKNQTF
jgi:predicted AAA+ superfamily ATPase